MTLTAILQNLIDAALATDTAVEKPLAGGLRVHLRQTTAVVGEKGVEKPCLMLTIWREGVAPSAREWNTVVAYWPYALGAINWSQAGMTEQGKCFKQARIPIREKECQNETP